MSRRSFSSREQHQRLKVVKVDESDFNGHDKLGGSDAAYVVTAIRNREPWKELENDWLANVATTAVVKA